METRVELKVTFAGLTWTKVVSYFLFDFFAIT
jgi:hypothetical protein